MLQDEQYKDRKKDGLNAPPTIDAPSSFSLCLSQRNVMCAVVQYVCYVSAWDEWMSEKN